MRCVTVTISFALAISFASKLDFFDRLSLLHLQLNATKTMTDVFELMETVHSMLTFNDSTPFGDVHQYYVSNFYCDVIARLEDCRAFNHKGLAILLRIMMEQNLILGIGFERAVWHEFGVAFVKLLDARQIDKNVQEVLGNLRHCKKESDRIRTLQTLWMHSHNILPLDE